MQTYSAPEAKIICDSISPDGIRLTTMEVKIHRFILAELNTHRVFSRNSASSRAIPVKKLLERVKQDPAMPMYWGKNKPGMNATEELEGLDRLIAEGRWIAARDNILFSVQQLLELGVHKQLANRLLEPWLWHTVIITATDWSNFFHQRLALDPESKKPYAQPEMYHAAKVMQEAYNHSIYRLIDYHSWHLPYITEEDREWATKNTWIPIESLKNVSVARCARVSYLTHTGERSPEEDLKLTEKLISASPMHASPFEHIARPAYPGNITRGNFRGWHQYRHEFTQESIKG